MRVFVTGATGFIGSAIVQELRQAGHDVLGLARNDDGAKKLAAAGIAVHRGELADHATLIAGIRQCDGVIHTAFIHDFSKFEENCLIDRRAVTAMMAALAGSDKPFVLTSGTALLAPGRLATEADAPPPNHPVAHRAPSEQIVLDAAKDGVRTSIMRLPPSVHGAGDHGFVPILINIAREKGLAAYVGEGANRWPAVHRLDVARLYRLALEKAEPGTRLHAVAEEGVPMREIAAAIGAGLGLPVRGLSGDEAAAHFGWIVGFAGIDNPTSSARTRASFDWQPTQPGLLADIRASGYFG